MPNSEATSIADAREQVASGKAHVLVVGLHPGSGYWLVACPYRSSQLSILLHRTTIIRE